MSLTVLKPGLFATVQDLGRYGYQQYGVVISGAMDEPAARVANWLVGNRDHEAVLELTLTGTVLRAERDLWVAICGGDMGARTDAGEAVPLWRPVWVSEGTILSFRQYGSGCRTYVAIAGGLDASMSMGSRSTYLRGGIGGLDGRTLRAGDWLEARQKERQALVIDNLEVSPSGKLKWPLWHAGGFAVASRNVHAVRLMPGEHQHLMSAKSLRHLFDEVFRIGSSSDRMGYRLQSDRKLLMGEQMQELISEPVVHGTIQLPPDGTPIVLLADRQTTGGYPRIGQVASVDIPVFGQLKPGDSIRFYPVTPKEAERLKLESELDMDQLRTIIGLKLHDKT
ncbi:biotin-dependent carboxyltransferase family protein [Paenibacillus sp. 1011MAR3C5]|uniref:5-oxoprolinase subunit C family protein n=1 Tax=Paenibacillus sp. 1011MAR3C5 TaxID=1675787 RepID=UPI000E6B5B65|nr:biotin-dependent carboxyltransferase family protein [Paenibacillus sp. 1011MAR3C5]RJE88672.1 biotin-dependent carboxyltransferase family protein [Paenibacillus sp. 1011MAR3C5]